jgi:hypothetical protein
LTREQNLDELDEMDVAKGGKGIPSLIPFLNFEDKMVLFCSQLEVLESRQDVSKKEIQSLLKALNYLWDETSGDPDLNLLLLNLHGRVQNLKRASIPLKGVSLFGNLNQFSTRKKDGSFWPAEASKASCTLNSLMYISFVLQNKIFEEADTLDSLLEESREQFEGLLKTKAKYLDEIEGSEEEKPFLLKYGGDALHVSEVPDLEKNFHLSLYKGFETRILTGDKGTSFELFKDILESAVRELKEHSLEMLGAVIQCNGSTYGLTLRLKEERVEVAIFDSHGCFKIHGKSQAYVYTTIDLEDAGLFLSTLIPFIDIEFEEGEDPLVNIENEVAVYLYKGIL